MFSVKDIKTGWSYTTERLNSGHFSEEFLQDLQKRSASSYTGPNPAKLYCTCRNPNDCDEKFDMETIRYSIQKSKLGRYFPKPYKNNHGVGHASYCLKNPHNMHYQVLNPAYRETDKDGKSVRSRINFSTAAQKKDFKKKYRYDSRVPAKTNEDIQGIICSPYELFSLKSEVFFHDISLHGHLEFFNGREQVCRNPIPLKYNLCKKILNYNIKIGDNIRNMIDKPMSEYTVENDGFAFVYDVITGIYDEACNWGDDNYYVTVFAGKHSYQIPVWFFRTLANRFSNRHSNRKLEYGSDKYKLILAGSYKRNKENNFSLNKGTFLMASPKYGLISDSVHEARFYDMVMEEINSCNNNGNCKRYKKVAFFKPYLFIPGGIYNGEGLPDGILQSLKTNRQCVIEIYGSLDPSYLKQREKKEKWMKEHSDNYDYFYWDVCDKTMDFEDIREKFIQILEHYCEI